MAKDNEQGEDKYSPEKLKILEARKRYISLNFVLFEMIKALKHRELSFISPKPEKKLAIRYLVALTVEYLKKHLNWISFNEKFANMYMSVAVLKDIPVFSYNLAERLNDEKYKDFNKNYVQHIIGSDLFFDFDGKEDYELCLSEFKTMKKILDEFKVPYWAMSSSKKGFHIHIPFEFMPSGKTEESIKILASVLYNISGIYSFKTLDLSISDHKRLCKLPYSPVIDGSVCLPLNDYQIENFRPDMIEIDNVLRLIKIFNRGLLVRKFGLTDEELSKNVAKFLEDFK